VNRFNVITPSNQVLIYNKKGEPKYVLCDGSYMVELEHLHAGRKPSRKVMKLSRWVINDAVVFECKGCETAENGGCELTEEGRKHISRFVDEDMIPCEGAGTKRFITKTDRICSRLDKGSIVDFGTKKRTIEPLPTQTPGPTPGYVDGIVEL